MSYFQKNNNNQPINYPNRDIRGDIGYPENHNYPNNYQNNNNNQPMNYSDKGYSENRNYPNNDYNYSNNDYNHNYNNYEGGGPISNVNDSYHQPNLNSPTEYHNYNNNNNYNNYNNYNNNDMNNNYNNDMNNNYPNDMNNLETSSNNVTYTEETKGYSPLGGGGGVIGRESITNNNISNNNNNNNNKDQRGSTIFGSQIAFMKDENEKQRKKHGGLMKCLCCGSKSSWKKCCCIGCCIFFLIIIAIVAAILLWAKAPEVEFLNVGPSPNGLPSYVAQDKGFDFNFGLMIRVNNPNLVGAKFSKIVAVAFYPGHTERIGGGNLTNVNIARKANTTINFPFSVNYDSNIDPGFTILLDIAKKCGLTGGTKQQLEIDYTLTLSLKVILITVSPSFNKKAFIDCPIQDGQIPDIPGFNLSDISGITNKVKKIKRNFSTSLDPSL